jgi:hypothetical protein
MVVSIKRLFVGNPLLHNQSSRLLKGSLLFKKGVIVTSVPYHLEQ